MKQDVNIETYKGIIPIGSNLIVYEGDFELNPTGDSSKGFILYGFDEIGLFDRHFNSPKYCFKTSMKGEL